MLHVGLLRTVMRRKSTGLTNPSPRPTSHIVTLIGSWSSIHRPLPLQISKSDPGIIGVDSRFESEITLFHKYSKRISKVLFTNLLPVNTLESSLPNSSHHPKHNVVARHGLRYHSFTPERHRGPTVSEVGCPSYLKACKQ
jgi:hypothetical protein